MKTEILKWFAIVGIPLILVGGGWLVKKLVEWIDMKKEHEWNGYVAGMLHRLTITAWKAVNAVGQTYSDAIKAASSDGKLTEGEKTHALTLAIDEIKRLWGKDGIEELMNVLGITSERQLDDMLTTEIESAVAARKEARAVPSLRPLLIP